MEIAKRKMDHKEEFEEYFLEFIEELKNGVICKRKKTSNNIPDNFIGT